MNVAFTRPEERAEVAARIDPGTATVFFLYTLLVDPYGDLSDEEFDSSDPAEMESCVGRSYFAYGLDGKAVYWGDLPVATRAALDAKWTEADREGWEQIAGIARAACSSDNDAQESSHGENYSGASRGRSSERLAASPSSGVVTDWIEGLVLEDLAWVHGVTFRRLAYFIGVSVADLYTAFAERAAVDPACRVVGEPLYQETFAHAYPPDVRASTPAPEAPREGQG